MSDLRIKRQLMPVHELLRSAETLQLDPGYQREGGIWTRDRQQLFVDSILNGFDVPPMYLHRLRPPEFREGRAATYAVVDGRQRLEALVRFAADGFRLASDFRLLEEVEDVQPPLSEELALGPARHSSRTLSELRTQSPSLYYKFMDYGLPVTIIETSNTDLIEELFFRLNEGVPLTPAEKRSRGALLREHIHPLILDEDLLRCARFRSLRRSYEDLLIRLLYLKDAGANLTNVPDMKKKPIDDFAASFRPPRLQRWSDAEEANARNRLKSLLDDVRPTLNTLNSIFEQDDKLLATINTFLVHYLVVQELLINGEDIPPRRVFQNFADELSSLRGRPEEELSDNQTEALEYAQPIQGSTTGSYFKRRGEILLRYLRGDLRLR